MNFNPFRMMIRLATEKKLLQVTVLLACVVPLSAGLYGAAGSALPVGMDMDNHFRYLSGLLLGIGISFLISIPHIELHPARFRLLTLIVVTGGLCRFFGFLLVGVPGFPMLFALVMELLVTPLVCLWQNQLAKRFIG